MPKLLLVRHGNTELNSAQRFWGQTDVDLSASGIKQAEQLRDYLASQKIDAVYASNLSRARVTADIIASKHQLEIKLCAELREINFGLFEGLTFEEISNLHPEQAKLLAVWDAKPQFPSGESLDDLNKRVSKFLPILQEHASEETILIVTHSGVLRLLLCNLLGIDLWHWRQMRVDLASLSILDTYPQGAILSRLNDVSHLDS
ncbi:alpha-ribazole phosphatase [Chloroflexota bacterium]